MATAYMIWRAMSGNGAQIGMILIRIPDRKIQQDRLGEHIALFAVDRGSIHPKILELHSAFQGRRRPLLTILVFVAYLNILLFHSASDSISLSAKRPSLILGRTRQPFAESIFYGKGCQPYSRSIMELDLHEKLHDLDNNTGRG